MCMCVCPWKPEEGVRSRTGVRGSCELPHMVLLALTEFGSSGTRASALNNKLSPAPQRFFIICMCDTCVGHACATVHMWRSKDHCQE